jgi:hypothetical protein
MLFLDKIIKLLKNKYCKHEFIWADLRLSGIPEPDWKTLPVNEMYTHDATTKRVQWPCCKCGKVIYAHCGLDILSKYGNRIRNGK